MRYIDHSLTPSEQILVRGQWPGIFWFSAWAALIVLGIAIVGIFIFLRAAIIMWTTDFAVTNKRVVVKRGWLNRRTQELAVESVEGVVLDQSFVARIFGYGRIVVTGTGDAVLVFPPMANPVAFRRAIEEARSGVTLAPRAANEDAAIADDVEEEEPERPSRRRHSSFIGIRSR